MALFVALLAPPTLADTLKNEADIRAFGDRVMGTLAKSGMQAAFDAMRPYAPVPDSEFQTTVNTSKAQREQFASRYGKTIGYDFAGQKKVGESVIRLRYVERAERHAMSWTFYFYKTPSGWILNSFQWNDRMQNLFSE